MKKLIFTLMSIFWVSGAGFSYAQNAVIVPSVPGSKWETNWIPAQAPGMSLGYMRGFGKNATIDGEINQFNFEAFDIKPPGSPIPLLQVGLTVGAAAINGPQEKAGLGVPVGVFIELQGILVGSVGEVTLSHYPEPFYSVTLDGLRTAQLMWKGASGTP